MHWKSRGSSSGTGAAASVCRTAAAGFVPQILRNGPNRACRRSKRTGNILQTGGWKENSVYEGIPEVLKQLKDAGAHLYIATSKPEPFAKRIAEHFGLDGYFDRIAGATLDERITGKGQVIQMLLEELADIPVSNIVMVGDREHDVLGAKEHGIACVGVLYGYGSRAELEQAQAMTICPTPEALLTCL